MAIFGIGATYDKDVSDDFIRNDVACVGWDINDAPSIHEIIRLFKIGDIIYIKTFPIGQGMRIKAVGIITDSTIRQIPQLGSGVSVRWVWHGYENIGTIDDKYNIRMNTLYEEHNTDVQEKILELLFSRINTQ